MARPHPGGRVRGPNSACPPSHRLLLLLLAHNNNRLTTLKMCVKCETTSQNQQLHRQTMGQWYGRRAQPSRCDGQGNFYPETQAKARPSKNPTNFYVLVFSFHFWETIFYTTSQQARRKRLPWYNGFCIKKKTWGSSAAIKVPCRKKLLKFVVHPEKSEIWIDNIGFFYAGNVKLKFYMISGTTKLCFWFKGRFLEEN